MGVSRISLREFTVSYHNLDVYTYGIYTLKSSKLFFVGLGFRALSQIVQNHVEKRILKFKPGLCSGGKRVGLPKRWEYVLPGVSFAETLNIFVVSE